MQRETMRTLLLTTWLMLSAFVPGTAGAEGRLGVEWEEVAGNPLLTPGSCFSWRCAGVGDPTIARAADGRLTVWFTTMGIHLGLSGFETVGPVLGIAHADASLKSVEVSPESAIIPVGREGAWDRYVETPTVRRSA